MNSKPLDSFCSQFFGRLGRLLSEGVPLIKALQAARFEYPEKYSDTIKKVELCLENGNSFYLCLAGSGLFPETILERIEHAEKHGILDKVCSDISQKIDAGTIKVDSVACSDPSQELIQSEEKRKTYITLTERILLDAIKSKASDIHIDPEIECSRIRYRIDGVLQTQPLKLTKDEHRGIISRIKMMSNLDVSEHKIPQDGRILMNAPEDLHSGENKHLDLRVSICPFIRGEKSVIRILDTSGFPTSFKDIGLSEFHTEIFQRWIKTSHGLIIVSGPTGSGKTTTLYLILMQLAQQEQLNVVSLEHPVEYILDNVYQMQVEPSLGLTFTAGMRSILRQDPDVISVGEIRDTETAQLLALAAQTGHLALSQLHSHNAVSSLKLLYDLGIPEYTLKEIIVGIASQRLVRKLCKHCKTVAAPADIAEYPEEYRPMNGTIFKAVGCAHCHQTGYRGRAMLLELLEPQKNLWNALAAGAPREDLVNALPDSFHNLKKDGIRLVREGITSIDEVIRVVG